MIIFATMLWDANPNSMHFSRCYDEKWVEKLYRGVVRNLTKPFRFICYSNRWRAYAPDSVVEQQIMQHEATYSAFIEPFELGRPMILVGLDTIITGNIDHLATYCLHAEKVALPRAPYDPETVCNGVALVPRGHRGVYEGWDGHTNDMEWMRRQDYSVIDDLFPGHVVSYKKHVKGLSLGDARIVYFHGREKPHEIDEPFVQEHWI